MSKKKNSPYLKEKNGEKTKKCLEIVVKWPLIIIIKWMRASTCVLFHAEIYFFVSLMLAVSKVRRKETDRFE